MADKVKEFFVNKPKYNEDKDFEAYSSMTLAINLLFIVNVLLHSVYLVGFSLVGIQELAIVEIIDVTLYAAGCGGEGRAPIGRKGPVTPWGKPALGYKTRNNKRTDKFIVRRRGSK